MKQLQEAFDALLPTDEQEERMLCEILVARDGRPRRRMRGNPVRVAALTAAALALCVVTASAAEALGVSQMVRDYFQKKEEVSVMDKLNVAASGLSTTTADGWKITITDLFGDQNRAMIGVTVEAPAGTDLDRSDYLFTLHTSGKPHTLPSDRMKRLTEDMNTYDIVSYRNYLQQGTWVAEQIPDDNPRDNKISFIFDKTLEYYQDGITVDFTFGELSWNEVIRKEPTADGGFIEREEGHVVKDFQHQTSIKNVSTHFASSGYHLTPNTSIKAFGGNATVSKFVLSPLSISFELSGDYISKYFFDIRDLERDEFWKISNALRPTRKERFQRWRDSRAIKNNPDQAAIDWANKPMKDWDNDDWYGWADTDICLLDTPLVLHFKDGTSREVNIFISEDENATPFENTQNKTFGVTYCFDTPLDLDTVDYVTICDARISLPAEAIK